MPGARVRLEFGAYGVAEALLACPAGHYAPVPADSRQLAGILPQADVPGFNHEERRALLHGVAFDLPPHGRRLDPQFSCDVGDAG